jgi:hypothetical protein
VAVHGIDAVDERDPEVRSQRLHLQPIDGVGPALGGVGIDEIVAAVEHGAKEELAHLRALQSGREAWVIWPTFSARLIWPSSSSMSGAGTPAARTDAGTRGAVETGP